MSVNQSIENIYIRQEAVAVTRRFFWPLLGISALLRIVTGALEKGLTAIGDALMLPEINEVMEQFALLSNSARITSVQPTLDALTQLLTSPKFILFNLMFMLLTSLVNDGMYLGFVRQQLNAARGIRPMPLKAFAGMKHCLKALGLSLWTKLKVALWLLPGVVLMFLGSALLSSGLSGIGDVVVLVGLGVMFALGLRAALRYALATYILADKPDRSIRICTSCSASLMDGRLWQYIRALLPVLLKVTGAYVLANFVWELIFSLIPATAQVSSAVGTVLIFAATAYFILQMDMVSVVFYLRTLKPIVQGGAPKPVSNWLREHTANDIAPAQSDSSAEAEASPENTPATNDEQKETDHEEPVC